MMDNSLYYTNINHPLLESCPQGDLTVLEVGCGAGALLGAYKQKNPDACCMGLEIMPEQARNAEKNIDRVFTGDVEKISLGELGIEQKSIDLLIYGDVLEHLVDPWRVLDEHIEYLKPGGQIRSSVPNIGHFSIIVSLLQGKWDYMDSGLLDRTHLRFFTYGSVEALFSRPQLKVESVNCLIYEVEQTSKIIQQFIPVMQHFGIPVDKAALNQMAATQFLVKAERVAPSP